MTRLDALASLLEKPKNLFFTRSSYLTHQPIDETEDEFILKENGMDRYYVVLKGEEERERRFLEAQEAFGEDAGADLEEVYTYIGEQDGYQIYTT